MIEDITFKLTKILKIWHKNPLTTYQFHIKLINLIAALRRPRGQHGHLRVAQLAAAAGSQQGVGAERRRLGGQQQGEGRGFGGQFC